MDIDKGTSKKVEPKGEIRKDVPLFGSVDDYSNLSEAEKVAMTEAMMKKHRGWAGKALK